MTELAPQAALRPRVEADNADDAGPAPSRVAVLLALAGVLAVLGLMGYGLFVRGVSGRGGLAVNESFNVVAITPKPAPSLQMPIFAGGSGTFDLASARGKVVMIDFWASWCGPCRDEAPVLARVWQRYKDQDVIFVGVNTLGDRRQDAQTFVDRYGITYLNGQDPGRIAVDYGLTGVPEKSFVDRDGRVVRKAIGPMSESTLVATLEELLHQPS